MRNLSRPSRKNSQFFSQPLEDVPKEFKPFEKLVYLTPTLEIHVSEEYINFKHRGQYFEDMSGGNALTVTLMLFLQPLKFFIMT